MATRRQKTKPSDGPSIPLAPVDHNKKAPSGQKTLYEIAAERQAELLASQGKQSSFNDGKQPPKMQYVHMNADGEIIHSPLPGTSDITPSTAESESSESLPPIADTMFLSLSLSCIHFTLSFLAAHQFAQEIELNRILFETLVVAFPVMTLLIHFVHGHIVTFPKISLRSLYPGSGKKTASESSGQLTTRKSLILALFPPTPHNIIFLTISIFLGSRLIAMANEASYYAAMKKTPALGTLWVWAVVEMTAGFSVLGLAVPVMWAVWWKGHSLW
ncbi:hypothetical protein MGYG_07621 [Nannizzia gypsea CBS 118893]|uniref:DUF7719 domain-containing protein n=1 Tax=Arthroderma gypseum (strain ATCC MYA-4604 / CBS 118893) TaxID=535722 RepID=E4V3P0_ARTGP|nr:hypothetical protein MGYG_07621 [Nannizzia gypsea CBS 118893]EFR04614.1 hypothetical protein MGYG_07621 [Nannizzia gypsea CBS 118893]